MTDHSPEYLIERILPSHEIHLLAGPSGSGKTTWIGQQLSTNWVVGSFILGHAVNPVPFSYISADRSQEGTLRTFKRLSIDPAIFPHLSLTSKEARADGLRDTFRLLDWFYKHSPTTKLLVIDGFMGMLPPRHDRNTDGGFAHISNFLTEIQGELTDRDLTLLGMCHSPKVKEETRYANPRERIMGSAAWAAHCETIIILEPADPSNKAAVGQRTLILCPRNAPEQFIDLQFSAGRLVEMNLEVEMAITTGFLGQVKEGNTFETKSALEALMSSGVSKPTAERELRQWKVDGRIVEVRKGLYRKPLRS